MKSVNFVLVAAYAIVLGISVRLAGHGGAQSSTREPSAPADEITATSLAEKIPRIEEEPDLRPHEGKSTDNSQEPAEIKSSNPKSAPVRALDRIVAIPVAFQGGGSAGIGLDVRQKEVIAELRQKFRDDLADSSQDPADPRYLKRWQQAQRENDDLLAGLLGGQFFLDYQIPAIEPAIKP